MASTRHFNFAAENFSPKPHPSILHHVQFQLIMNIPTSGSFFARNGMYVTKENIRHDKLTRSQNPPIPTNPDSA
jgi:hypothetical protein